MAAARSGASGSPTQKEWSLGKLGFFLLMCLLAIEATRDESRPPERRTPQGTSDIMRLVTAFSKQSRRRSAL